MIYNEINRDDENVHCWYCHYHVEIGEAFFYKDETSNGVRYYCSMPCYDSHSS